MKPSEIADLFITGHINKEKVPKLWIGEYLLFRNPSRGLPYHNNNHICIMTRDVAAGLEYYGVNIMYSVSALLASMFHDFDHSGGAQTDDKNIERAIVGFKSWKRDILEESENDVEVILINGLELKFDSELVELFIKYTQYPYVEVNKPEKYYSSFPSINQVGNILRDADLMTSFHKGQESQLIGLFQEIKNSKRIKGMSYTYKEFCADQIKFLTDVENNSPHREMFTNWGNELIRSDKVIENRLKYINEYKAITGFKKS